jgi:hypothetical protein
VVWRCDYVHLASPGLALLLPSPTTLNAAHSAPPAAPGSRTNPAAAAGTGGVVDGVFAVLPGPGGGGGRGHPRLYSCRQREVLVKALVAEGKTRLGVAISGEPSCWMALVLTHAAVDRLLLLFICQQLCCIRRTALQ